MCQAIANAIKYDRIEFRANTKISSFTAIVEKTKFNLDSKVLKALGTSFSVYQINENYIYVQKPATRYNMKEYE